MESNSNMLDAAVTSPQCPNRLIDQFEKRLAQCSRLPTCVALELDVDPFGWLEQQPLDFKVVWGQRGEDRLTLGLGVAKRVAATSSASATDTIHRCRTVLGEDKSLRFYGGFAFRGDDQNPPAGWEDFGPGCFWLPRATLVDGRLAIVILNEADVQRARRFVRQLTPFDDDARSSSLPCWIRRFNRPNRDEWNECIEKAMRLFDDEVLEKIVLARQVEFEFATPLSPLALISRLQSATPACYHFCFQTAPYVGFVGATPERLFWRQGHRLLSEVVAGTRPRGRSTGEDEDLGDQLLASAKDQLEHDIVRKSIRQRLHARVEHLQVDAKASLLRLANKQHLFSQVSARLMDNVGDGELIDRLHPTPAVGGYPTENALDEIRHLEPFQRGWYAAPVGWIGSDEAEFAVAIRSGLVHAERLTLYSGAGIVPGSTASAEWDEIEQKISDFLALLPSAGAEARAVGA